MTEPTIEELIERAKEVGKGKLLTRTERYYVVTTDRLTSQQKRIDKAIRILKDTKDLSPLNDLNMDIDHALWILKGVDDE